MSSSTSHKPRSSRYERAAQGGGGSGSGGDDSGGGGGGGGGGDLVKVAFARNQAEAEMLQGLLSEAGIPSVLKRSFGFDNPDFLSSGPRDVMVPASGHDAAREVLLETEIIGAEAAGAEPKPSRVLAVLIGVMVLVALVVWLGTELGG